MVLALSAKLGWSVNYAIRSCLVVFVKLQTYGGDCAR